MYSDRLLNHFRDPRNAGQLPAPAVSVEVSNPACGDVLRLSVRIEGDHVAEARFKAHGCTASIAAGSVLTEWILAKNLDELARLAPFDIEQALDGLPQTSKHAATLAVDAVRALAAKFLK